MTKPPESVSPRDAMRLADLVTLLDLVELDHIKAVLRRAGVVPARLEATIRKALKGKVTDEGS